MQIALIGFEAHGSYISVVHTREKKTSIKSVVLSLVTKLRILAAEKVRTMHVKDVVTGILSYIALDIFLAVETCIFPWADKSKL